MIYMRIRVLVSRMVVYIMEIIGTTAVPIDITFYFKTDCNLFSTYVLND